MVSVLRERPGPRPHTWLALGALVLLAHAALALDWGALWTLAASPDKAGTSSTASPPSSAAGLSAASPKPPSAVVRMAQVRWIAPDATPAAPERPAAPPKVAQRTPPKPPPPPSSPPPIRNRSPAPGLRPRARQSPPCWPKAPLPTPTAQHRARPSRCQATPLWRPSRRRSLQMRAHQHRIRHRPHTATLRPHQPKPACRPPPHNPHCCRATAGCATTCWGKPKA